MPRLFEPTEINGMKLKNRFVRSATYTALAEVDGTATDRLPDFMAQLARGEVGLIITGHAYVTREGQAGPRQLGLYSDAMTEGLKRLTAAVRDSGGVVAVQLAHAGKKGIGKGAYTALGPSEVVEEGEKKASAMSIDDIRRTITAFGDAAERAVASGFDAVQIHAAHGYLLSQFLSPRSNKRDDGYGGILANRSRLLLEVTAEIRTRVGASYPVLAKINSEDFLEGGFTVADMLEVAQMLADRGLDAIEMSGGTFESGKFIPSRKGTAKSKDREAYYREAAKAFKKALGIPLVLVGGVLSYDTAEEIVASGLADYVALSRALIREPRLVKRWQDGDRRKATCVSCNKCFATLATKEALHCAVEEKERRKSRAAPPERQ